jgi:ADP-ribosylglycohydrolase
MKHSELVEESKYFSRILNAKIYELKEEEIYSTGYVIHSLEAAFWCLMRNTNYAETVLNAVNLGEDTDTTAAITGGLAGIIYGSENIPQKWIDKLAKKLEIEQLAEKFEQALK